MAIATDTAKNTVVSQWLEQVDGLALYEACDTTDGNLTTAQAILDLAERCDWAELEPLPAVSHGLYAHALELGFGDVDEAYQDSNPERSQVFYFMAK